MHARLGEITPWSRHIEVTVAKANKTFDLLHRVRRDMRVYNTLYNEQCKTSVLIGLEECVIRV